jgi:fructokinase
VLTVIGEALVDRVPEGPAGRYRDSPGGSPFNVAVGLARLGNRTSLMARFADDRFGRLLRAAAAQEGIDLSAAPHAAERASVATASVDRAGQVTYEFDMDGTADWQWSTAELRAVSPATRVLHFGSIAAWTPPGAERIAGMVRELGAPGSVLISYDPNIRPSVIGPREQAAGLVERNLRLAHIVKASREDLAWLYPELQTEQVAARWTRLGPALVVVTDGADGASAYRRAGPPLGRPGRRVDVVDTIGAGDAFTAGLLTGVVRRRLQLGGRIGSISEGTLADILDEAILVSAITCERAGADPPRLAELSPALRAGA